MATDNSHIFNIAHIMGVEGIYRAKLAPLSDEDGVRIGQSVDCHIVLDSPRTAKQHARIYSNKKQWFISNEMSGGSILLNGNSVTTTTLAHGDLITIGEDSFVFIDKNKGIPDGHALSLRYIEDTFAPVLLLQEPDGERQCTLEEQTTTIGSEKFNDIVISDASVSSNHCKVKSDEGLHSFVDLKSTNGSKVNDVPVTTEAIITAGDEITAGTVVLVFNFIRKDKKLATKGSMTLGPLTIILLILAGLVITAGVSLLILIALTLYSDIPPFGTTLNIKMSRLWVSDEKTIIPFTVGRFTTNNYCSIAIAPSTKRIVCLDGISGLPRWSYSTVSHIAHLNALPVTSKDGQGEKLLATSTERLFLIDRFGARVWETPFGEFFSELTYSSWDRLPSSKTIIYGTSKAGTLFTIDSSTGEIKEVTPLSMSNATVPVGGNKLKAQYSDDDLLSSVHITSSGKLRKTKNNGTILWESTKGDLLLKQKIVIGDIENDGLKEVIVLSANRESAFVIDTTTGKAILTLRPGHKITGIPALGKIHANGAPKIVLPLADNTLCVFNSTSGELIRKINTAPYTKGISGQPCLYDIDRDEEPDVIISTENGELIILSLKDSKILAREKLSFSSSGMVSLADINGDKRIDIITQLADGRIEVFTVNCPCDNGQLITEQPTYK